MIKILYKIFRVLHKLLGGGKMVSNSTPNMTLLEQTLRTSHDWAIDRIHYLSEKNIDDAYAIQAEFSEWMNPDIPEHDVFSLEYLGDT
jgi:hypothetical protein